jgi:DnaJ-class molecular chaperone
MLGFDAEDLLSQMFGGGAGRARASGGVKKGAAIHTQINIPFMDAVNGTTRQVTVYANVGAGVDGEG